MGFCLLNNVAITAAALADRGERVVVVDYDAHHGNGTQDIFAADPRVLYVSFRDYPLITERVLALAPPGRSVVFLEGGYDLDALRDSVAATLPVLVGERPGRVAEAPTSGGPGGRMVEVVEEFWRERRGG